MTSIQAYPPTKRPELHLIYASDQLPIPDEAALQRCLDAEGACNLTWVQQDPSKSIGRASLDGHELLIAGLPIPLPPEVIDHTVMVSPWQAQTKAAMRQHRAHISLVYHRGHHDPIEAMIAIYRLACAFANEDLLGIVNTNAWTAHPPADFLKPASIASFRESIPYNLWFGYVRFFTDDPGYWLVTKGHHIFDVPDLAYYVQPAESSDDIIRLFINVFHYLYEEDVFVTAGDTLEVGTSGQQLKFVEVTEWEEVLMGPSGTLVIEKNEA